MQSQEIVVAKLIEQLQTYLEDLRAGRPMNRTAALLLGDLIPDLRTVVADRLRYGKDSRQTGHIEAHQS